MSDEQRHHEDLSPEEREGYRRLSRQREPGDLLEERVVRALKDRGLLKGANAPSRPRPSRWKPGWTAAAVAATLILFLSGLVVGQWMGARTATTTFLAIQEGTDDRAADRVQAAGTEYVRALTRFAEVSGEGATDEATQGREAALGALLAATEILARLESDDPGLAALLDYLEESRGSSPAAADSTRRVYWF